MIINEAHQKRFYANVQKTDSCWVYLKSIEGCGYGRMCINGKTVGAHRVSYLIHNGSIPEKMFVCHKCDNPSCVNPEHLFLGTPKDNTEDMMKKERGSLRRGRHHPCAKLTETEVREIFNLSGTLSQRELAKKFKVTQGLITNILNHGSWKSVTSSMISLSSVRLKANQRGIMNSKAKLTEENVRYIFNMKKLVSKHELAKQFDVTEVTIRKIWSQHTWKHITNQQSEKLKEII